MKKTILLLTIMAFSVSAFAQKPVKGNLLTEVNVSLNQWTNELSIPNLRFRYFIADDLAVRADLSVSGASAENNFSSGGTDKDGTQEISQSSFLLRVGAEKHWAGTEKLSPFAFGMIGLANNSASQKWTDYDGTGYAKDFNAEVESGSSSFGIQLGMGADYWITKSFYVGTEFGWGWFSNNTAEGTSTVNGVKTTTPASSSSSFGEGMGSAGFRVGFILK